MSFPFLPILHSPDLCYLELGSLPCMAWTRFVFAYPPIDGTFRALNDQCPVLINTCHLGDPVCCPGCSVCNCSSHIGGREHFQAKLFLGEVLAQVPYGCRWEFTLIWYSLKICVKMSMRKLIISWSVRFGIIPLLPYSPTFYLAEISPHLKVGWRLLWAAVIQV